MNEEVESNQEQIEEINSNSWWTIGNKGAILGCGDLNGTWIPNKALLYDITYLQLQAEASRSGAKATNFSELVDKKITTYIDEINLRKHILQSSFSRMKKIFEKEDKNKKIKKTKKNASIYNTRNSSKNK